MRCLGGWEEFLQLSFPLEKQELVVVVLNDEHHRMQIWESTTECGARRMPGTGMD